MTDMPETSGDQHTASAEPALRSLHGELVLLIAEQARRVPVPVLLSASLMALLVMTYVPLYLPAAWLAVVFVTTVLHTRVLVRLRADSVRSDEQKLTVAAWSFALHGASIAVLFAFFPFVPVTIGAVITIYMVGICAATLHAIAGFARIYLPYALITLGPIAVTWGLSPGFDATLFERAVFVGLTLAYLVAMLGHAKGTYQVFTESYNIRLQRIELNQQLRDALGRAETANRAKTRFLASASHDLRQPIHALSLFSGSLSLRPLDPRTAIIAGQIDKAVKVLASQLDALLDISKLDAGVIEKSISAVDLPTLLAQLTEEFSPQAERKGLRLSVQCADATHVRTDPVLFQRILRNLLSNALNYTDAGQIELRVERVNDSKCRVAVRDTGPGIPQAEHTRIFEEFYQLHNPERDRTKGLGLGLAIVRRLTELLDIELRLDSMPGEGSCFSIELPLAAAHELPPPEVKPAPAPAAAHIQVLVVDDEEAIRLGMKTLLEEMGFGVRVAASTEAALDTARQWPPSIVLADFRLRGDDDGMRAIRSLRDVWPNLPALLISGDTAPDRLREAHRAGIDLLHKPVSSAALLESILKAVGE